MGLDTIRRKLAATAYVLIALLVLIAPAWSFADTTLEAIRNLARNLADGVVIKVVVSAADFRERYEYYYAGDKEEHERRYNLFATKGGALPGTRGDAYFQKQPRKVKSFAKPDFADSVRLHLSD